ncbi:hypothetical protein SAMN00808754_1589 [Thermanaeromonas toyohensis ToBE]|uniref:Holliday junction resolvase RusA (Prophage-encoded endonuclease) n=1 Tax=Thermanaeromonas toyohensis ToBE TaxID=698762 RepID=A0A1W1VTK6_9FIRM|nr:hypothetical protein [Thermanaeromonas toyohensis]SMB96688.1 hypothetical protein SAMN00808754_1589 [Thermanaeromonas toyohensis ToBE]
MTEKASNDVQEFSPALSEAAAALLEELDELNFRMASLSAQVASFEKLLSECVAVPGSPASGCKGFYDPGPPGQLYLFIPVAPPYLRVAWNRWPSQTNYRQVRQLWYGYVKEALKGIALPLEPFQQAVVVFKFTWGDTRTHDVDNYAVKFIVDALVKNNVIAGDSCEKMSLVVLGEKRSFWSTQVLVTPQVGQLASIREIIECWEKIAMPDDTRNGNNEAQQIEDRPQNLV